MTNYETKIFAAQLRDDLPTLDLHGMYPDEAIDKLELFLFDNFDKNNDIVIKIIYGGGTGKLGDKVRGYLKNHNITKEVVKEFGSCLVII